LDSTKPSTTQGGVADHRNNNIANCANDTQGANYDKKPSNNAGTGWAIIRHFYSLKHNAASTRGFVMEAQPQWKSRRRAWHC